MRKILSILLVVVIVCSIGTTALAIVTGSGDPTANDYTQGTTIEVVGQYASAEYTVTVPAKLEPGETAQVMVKGAWMPSQTLKVSCPNTVTLSYEGQTMDIGISFAGIEQVGSYTEAFNISKDISVEDKTVLFGTWTGHLDYTVEFVDKNATRMPTFKITRPEASETTVEEFQYEEGMTWREWVESEYNTKGYTLCTSPFGVMNANGDVSYWPCVATSGTPSYYVVYVDENVSSYNHYVYATYDRLVESADWFTSAFAGGADD